MASERDDGPPSEPPPAAGARSPRPPTDDEVLEREVEHAVAPYRNIMPPAVLEHMAEALREAFATHPTMSVALSRVRPRDPRDHSEEQQIGATGRPLEQPAAPRPAGKVVKLKGRT